MIEKGPAPRGAFCIWSPPSTGCARPSLALSCNPAWRFPPSSNGASRQPEASRPPAPNTIAIHDGKSPPARCSTPAQHQTSTRLVLCQPTPDRGSPWRPQGVVPGNETHHCRPGPAQHRLPISPLNCRPGASRQLDSLFADLQGFRFQIADLLPPARQLPTGHPSRRIVPTGGHSAPR